MLIDVSGKIKKDMKQLFADAASFFLLKMLDTTTLKNTIVNIKVRKKLEDSQDGYCDIVDYDGWNRPREFDVYVQKNVSVRYMLMTLAHECVHVKQYASGELKEGHNLWRYQIVPPDINYWESPWEIEAFGRERGLYTMYCEKIGMKFNKVPGIVERDE